MVQRTTSGMAMALPFCPDSCILAHSLNQRELAWWAMVLLNSRTRGDENGWIDSDRVGGVRKASFMDKLFGLGMIEIRLVQRRSPEVLVFLRANLPICGGADDIRKWPHGLAELLNDMAESQARKVELN